MFTAVETMNPATVAKRRKLSSRLAADSSMVVGRVAIQRFTCAHGHRWTTASVGLFSSFTKPVRFINELEFGIPNADAFGTRTARSLSERSTKQYGKILKKNQPFSTNRQQKCYTRYYSIVYEYMHYDKKSSFTCA